MKELANKINDYLEVFVMDELWLMNAISCYCYENNIELTEDEECDLIEILMNEFC